MIFDDLRYEEYRLKAFNFDLEKIPPTSTSMYKHMKRAYYQCYMQINAASSNSIFLDPLYYGSTLDGNETLVAEFSSSELPDDFPQPCTCGKCVDNVSRCWIKSTGCCEYCKCAKGECRKSKAAESMNDDFDFVYTL